MKRAKVSSVYEGRGRKRSMEGEDGAENSSKSARMSAKARTNGLRARKALSIISNNRTMMTRSMSIKPMEKEQEDLEQVLFEVEVVEAKEELDNNKNDNNINIGDNDNKAAEEEQQQPAVGNEAVENSKKGDDEVGLLTLEDWPVTWTYEEEWSWFKKGYECGWYSYWETMTGDYWMPRDHNNEAVWNDDDLWQFNYNNQTPNP